MDYKKLQNGSDIRGVALEGIEGQNVNLTEKVCRDIGRGFALWIIDMMIDNGFVGVANRVVGCIFTFSFAIVLVCCIASVTEFVLNVPALSQMQWVKDFNGGFVYKFFKGLSPLEILLSF